MRYLLVAAGFMLAAVFGLSAFAAGDDGVVVKYPTVAAQTNSLAVDTRLCTPSAAQADTLINIVNPISTAAPAALPATTRPCAMPGGASPGVGSTPTHSFYS